ELLKRRQDAAQQKPKPQPNAPERGSPDQPQQRQNPQQGLGAPEQPPPQPQPNTAPSQPSQTPPAPGMQQPMTQEQAERLLGSLGDLERLEQQNKRRSRVQREKRGKDW